jgi:MFS family permease
MQYLHSLDVSTPLWGPYNEELGISYGQLTNTYGANYAGFGVGCVFFIPFALKYGRRPVYIISTIITLATAIWQAKLSTYGSMLAAQLVSGLSGAVSETLVQITVSS